MTDTVALPHGWAWASVEELGEVGEQPVLTGPFGTNLTKNDFVSSGVPVLTIGCLTDRGLELNKAMFVQEKTAQALERYRLREGDFLFSRMASVGRASIVPASNQGVLFNYHIMRLRLSRKAYEPALFLAYVRGAPSAKAYIESVNHGGTRDGINTAQLLKMPIAVPPAAEQRRIVSKLESLQARSRRAKEALDAIPGLLERFRQSVLAAAFSGKTPATGRKVSSPPVVIGTPKDSPPQGWEWVPLSELAKLESGHTPRKSVPEYWGGDVPWISLRDIRAAHGLVLTNTEMMPTMLGIDNSSARLLPEGTVVFSRDISVGWVTIMGRSMATSQHFANWICGPKLSNKLGLQHIEWAGLRTRGGAHG